MTIHPHGCWCCYCRKVPASAPTPVAAPKPTAPVPAPQPAPAPVQQTPTTTGTSQTPQTEVDPMQGKSFILGSTVQSTITHGSQLTTAMVGPPGISFSGTFRTVTLPQRGYWRGDTPDEFVPAGTYVYNNSPTNYGGTVGGSPIVIDGFTVPAGTYVVQFMDLSNGGFYMSDGSNYVFRGCKYRAGNTAPGIWNCNVAYTGGLWINYCDLGGNGSAPGDFCEVNIDVQAGASLVCYRNRISFVGTGIQCELDNFRAIENYITDLTDFGNGTSHLNGMTVNGNVNSGLILRNHIVNQKFDSSGREVDQTDCISYFQDFGTFPGTGINADGSTGYFIDSNYVGGTGYCIYAGKNAGSGANSVKNMHVTNNLITTQAFSTGGFNGPVAAEPVWGTLGNVATNNKWADGASQGQIAFGS